MSEKMHTYPIIVVDGRDDPDDARERAGTFADQFVEAGIYDYGGPIDPAECPDEPTVYKAGTLEYRKALKAARETERRTTREYWTILKQAVDSFRRWEEPPNPNETFEAEFVVGIGLEGMVESGSRVRRNLTFGTTLWRAAKLNELLKGWPSTSRFLYDERERRNLPLADETRKGVYAVICDFHY